MKRIDKPTIELDVIFDDCVSGISDAGLVARFATAKTAVIDNFQDYDLRAGINQLYSFAPSLRAKINQIVLAGIEKHEFTDLYKIHMVSNGKPGRKHYDKLLLQVPLQKCPYCGFGQISTLDHFLSKARYPAFSVLSSNLVPSCADCNKGKGASVVTQNNQALHPYFELAIVENQPWLFAETIQTTPATVRYYVQPPDAWPIDLKSRVVNHFENFNLAKRFAIEAASEIVSLSQVLAKLDSQESREAHLSLSASVERQHRTNTWRAALFEALLGSDWFLVDGYITPN